VDFSSLGTRVRDFSLVAPVSAPGSDSGGHAVQLMALATSNGKILVRKISHVTDVL
jgi:hypothetical protein